MNTLYIDYWNFKCMDQLTFRGPNNSVLNILTCLSSQVLFPIKHLFTKTTCSSSGSYKRTPRGYPQIFSSIASHHDWVNEIVYPFLSGSVLFLVLQVFFIRNHFINSLILDNPKFKKLLEQQGKSFGQLEH